MNNKGFTLIELMVGLCVMAIMAAIALPATSGWRQSAQNKEVAREVVSAMRRARSIAVRQNQASTVTIDLTNRRYSHAGVVTNFPENVIVESKVSEGDVWQNNGTFSITFRPQGNASETIFVRINGDDNLEVRVDSTATGLAHM